MLAILPAILLAGMSAGVLGGRRWPMAPGDIAMLATLLIAISCALRQGIDRFTLERWPSLLLVGWLTWSMVGILVASPVPDVAWWALARDVIGACILLAGMRHAQALDEKRWSDPLIAAALTVVGITVASFFSGDLTNRLANIWGGVNVNLIAALLLPVLILPLVIPDMRRGLGRPVYWFVLLALAVGLLLCWFTGRRLALASLVLAVCGVGIFSLPGRGLRVLAGVIFVAVIGVVVAMATGAVPGTQNGDSLRPLLYRASWGEFLLHPLAGIGPAGGYAMQEGTSEAARVLTASSAFVVHPHSSLLEVLVSGGGIGLLLLLGVAVGLAIGVPPARRAAAGGVFGALLPAILVDAAPGSLLGHLWVPFVIGCACAPGETARTLPQRPAKMLVAGLCLLALPAAIWLLFQAVALTRIGRDPRPEQVLSAAIINRDPSFSGELVSLAQQKSGFDQRVLPDTLRQVREHGGWFMRWPELTWSMRGSKPTADDFDALAAVLRRTPFQDAPYIDLAASDPEQWSPALKRRARIILDSSIDSPGMDGAVVIWRQTIAAEAGRPLTPAEQARFASVFQRYPEVPGVTAAALWLHARNDYADPGDFRRLRMQMRLALSDSSLFAGMMKSLAPGQLARLVALDDELQLGLPRP